jgi:hypothetical protein
MTEVDTTVLNILGKQVSFITTNGFHFFDELLEFQILD